MPPGIGYPRSIRSSILRRGPAGPATAARPDFSLAGGEPRIDESRNRFLDRMQVDPLDLAGGAQDFLAQSATGFANRLMPGLERGLRATRSRFGNAVRSGGTQAGEENAFGRLFANPLQDRIAELATTSLGYGQNEAQRGVANARDALGFDENRFMDRLGFGEGVRRFDTDTGLRRDELDLRRDELRERTRAGRRGGGIGGFLGGLAGSFLGPLGTKAGEFVGGRLFGGR